MEETGDRPADAAKARTRLERLPTKPQRHRPPGRHPLGSCRPRAPRAGRPQMQGPHEAHAGRTSHPRNKLPPRVPARREPCRAVLCARDNRREPGALTQMGGLPRPPNSGQAVLAWRAGTALRGKAEERGPPPHCQPACGGPRGTRLLKPCSQTEICAWARTLQGPPGPPAPCNGWGPWHPAAERGPGKRAEPELHAARIPRGSLTGAHAGPWPTGRAALLGVGGPGRTVTADAGLPRCRAWDHGPWRARRPRWGPRDARGAGLTTCPRPRGCRWCSRPGSPAACSRSAGRWLRTRPRPGRRPHSRRPSGRPWNRQCGRLMPRPVWALHAGLCALSDGRAQAPQPQWGPSVPPRDTG